MPPPEATAASSLVDFLDRDLSWLEFNRRVLHEALDARTPLLERVKFLAIFTSNLDEFFMKRVGAIGRQVAATVADASDGSDSRRHCRVRQTVQSLLTAQATTYRDVIQPELARNGVFLLSWNELTDGQRARRASTFAAISFPCSPRWQSIPAIPSP